MLPDDAIYKGGYVRPGYNPYPGSKTSLLQEKRGYRRSRQLSTHYRERRIKEPTNTTQNVAIPAFSALAIRALYDSRKWYRSYVPIP
jgi:hypothetical protein